jgi:hypothetical protein
MYSRLSSARGKHVSPAGRCSCKLGDTAVPCADRAEVGKSQDAQESNLFARTAPDSASNAHTQPAMSEAGPVLAHRAKQSIFSSQITPWYAVSVASSLLKLTLVQVDRLNAVESQLAEMRRSIGYVWCWLE